MERVKLKKRRVTNHRALTSSDLSAREQMFVREFVQDFNGTQAVRRAGYVGKSAYMYASTLLRVPKIVTAIRAILQERSDRLEVTADNVAQYWWDLATADARELAPIKIVCCRHCYGIDHQYQFTLNEMRTARRSHEQIQLKISNPAKRVMFDELGGDGYDRLLAPVENCPECRGRGILDVQVPDLAKVSRGAQLLYDGFKLNRDGSFEVKMRDRSRAMENFEVLVGYRRPRKAMEVWEPDDMTDAQLDLVLQRAIDRGLLKSNQLIEHEDVEESVE